MTLTTPVGVAAYTTETWKVRHVGSTWFTIGAAMGGAVMGALLATAGRLLAGFTLWLTLIAAALYLTATALRLRFRAPSCGWRVPRHWRRLGKRWYGALFGVCLGTGVLTQVATGAFYVLAFAVAGLDWWVGAAVFALFGLGRALPMWIVARAVYNWMRGPAPRPQKYDCLRVVTRHRLAATLACVAVVGIAAGVISTRILPGLGFLGLDR